MKAATVLLLCLWTCSQAWGQEPIGFERWNPLPSSYHLFDQNCHGLQQEFNHPGGFAPQNGGAVLAPGGYQTTSEDDVERSKRFHLSDIEVRPNADGENVIDALVVTNTGSFERKSWMVCGLTQANIYQWTQVKGATLLDVERYEREGVYYWAAIIQENPFGVETQFLYGVTIDSIILLSSLDEGGWRVVDIEPVGFEGPCKSDGGVACQPPPIYAAVMVQNTGANYMGSHLEDGLTSDPLEPEGWQLVDREKVSSTGFGAWQEVRLTVDVDNQDFTSENHSQADIDFYNHSSYGIIVDLEWDDALVGIYDWYFVAVQPW